MDGLGPLQAALAAGAVVLLAYEFLIARPTEEERRWERVGSVAGAVVFLLAAFFSQFAR
mgnify:CR=1 FL=1